MKKRDHGQQDAAASAAPGALPAALRGQRVVPVPLALVALSIPFLSVWASAHSTLGTPESQADGAHILGSRAEARPLEEPLVFLGRDVRIPEMDAGYVDVWAVPSGWEARLLQRRGAVSPRVPGTPRLLED